MQYTNQSLKFVPRHVITECRLSRNQLNWEASVRYQAVIRESDSDGACESREYEREEQEITIFALLTDLTARNPKDSRARA